MGTYTPNYNLYMPSIGEQGWGELVSNNFEIIDTNLNDLQTQIDTINTQINTINTNIGDGTRVLSISSPPIINSENFGKYASYDGNVYIAQFYGNTTFSSIPQPPHSCRLMIISVNGNATFSGSIDTYPTTLQSELPPDSETTNTYDKEIVFNNFNSCTLTYTANANNSQITMNYTDYLNFIKNTNESIYLLSIPHAIAAGSDDTKNGTAGTASNTCNGGGGGYSIYTGGTGCIFGQYQGGNDGHKNGYGYGNSYNTKYRCGLVIIVNGNLTLNSTITQNGERGSSSYGGYGGGAYRAGGGGAPVFIYYTGTYVNGGNINVNGGSRYTGAYGKSGGAGGIKVTKISI